MKDSAKYFNELTKDIFLELLRSYHNGIGVNHGEYDQKEVAHNLSKEAYFMALEFIRTVREIDQA